MTQNEFIENVNKMNNEQQKEFYNNLRSNGISEEEILTIQSMAFYAKIFSNPEAYYSVRRELGEMLYKEFVNQ